MKIALLVDEMSVQGWMYDAIKKIKDDKDLEISMLVVNKTPKSKLPIVQKIKRKSNSLFYTFFNKFYLKRNSTVLQLKKVDHLIQGVDVLEVSTEKVGKYREKFPKSAINRIKDKKIDCLVRFGFGILQGEILNCCEYGMLSYHHGNPRLYRGGPPVFWEYMNKEKSVGYIIQRLNEELDGGQVLFEGEVPLLASYKKTFENLYRSSSIVLAEVIKAQKTNTFIEVEKLGPIYRLPNDMQFLQCILSYIKNYLRTYFDRIFLLDLWDCYYIPKSELGNFSPIQPSFEKFELDNFKLPGTSANRFVADPCIFQQGLQSVVLLESYEYEKSVGELYKYDDIRGLVKIKYDKTIGHLSFPRIIPNQKNRITIENSENDGLLIGELNKDALFFTRQIKGLEGKKLIDPLIVFREDEYYLLFTDKEIGFSNNIVVYQKKDLNEDSAWIPAERHYLNFKLDNGRLAGGDFFYEGKHFIPTQACLNEYGEGFDINLITDDLKLQSFNSLQHSSKIHTFDYNEGIGLCFDIKNSTYSVMKPFYKFRSKLRMLLS